MLCADLDAKCLTSQKASTSVDTSVVTLRNVPVDLVTELRSQPVKNDLHKQSSITGITLPSIKKPPKSKRCPSTSLNLSKAQSSSTTHHNGDPYYDFDTCDSDNMARRHSLSDSSSIFSQNIDDATVIHQAPNKPNTPQPEKRGSSRTRRLHITKRTPAITVTTSDPFITSISPVSAKAPTSTSSTRAPTSTSHLSEVSTDLLSLHDFDDSMKEESFTKLPKEKHDKLMQAALTDGFFAKLEKPKHDKPQHEKTQAVPWKRGAQIGIGSQGSVYRAINMESGHVFAVKEAFIDDSAEKEKQTSDIVHELEICKGLSHPHIVTFLGHEYSGNHLYIFMEFVPGGSMTKMLEEFGPLSEPLLKRSTCGLLEGLDYLHTREPPIVHRDIKGGNILVDTNFHVKLADFGCSKQAAMTTSFSTMGSVPWMAPEVIQGKEGYGRKADVWSLGCAIIEMATAERPWGRRAFDNILCAMRHIGFSQAIPQIPDTISASARDLICNCVRRNAEERMSAAELLQHEFLLKNNNNCKVEV